jgi:hypothetical protein
VDKSWIILDGSEDRVDVKQEEVSGLGTGKEEPPLGDNQNLGYSQVWWLTHIILPTWEAEIWRIKVGG